MEGSGQLHATAALPPWKEPPLYPLYKRLGEPQSHSECGGEEKNSQPPPRIVPENPDRSACSPKHVNALAPRRETTLVVLLSPPCGNEYFLFAAVSLHGRHISGSRIQSSVKGHHSPLNDSGIVRIVGRHGGKKKISV